MQPPSSPSAPHGTAPDPIAALAETELGPADGRAVLPFLAAVATQLGSPLEPGGRDRSPAREREAALRAVRVIQAATAPQDEEGGPDEAALLLAGDPALLAVFFGNVDLLFAAGYPGADAVGMAVVSAAWPADVQGSGE
ncbi:MAG TPA: hypothetical protein VFQ76_13450 [Longimicrobiaceae bacterium]|nr:hypothetical protein [Longimicrobiaceae bacterium]